jgi:hypothetical protein
MLFSTDVSVINIIDQFDSADKYLELMKEAILPLRLSRQAAWELRVLTGLRPYPAALTMGEPTARKQSARILCAHLEEAFGGMDDPDVRFYDVLVTSDKGVTSEQTPILDFTGLKQEAEEAIRSMHLSGIVSLHLQPVYNEFIEKQERTMVLYARAVCWGSGSELSLQGIKNYLNRVGSRRCEFGHNAVFVRHLTHGVVDVLTVAASFARFPAESAVLVPLQSGGWDLCSTIYSFQHHPVVRVAEGLSYLPMLDAIFAVGHGEALWIAWAQDLQDWHGERTHSDGQGATGGCKLDVPAFWEGVRQSVPSYYQTPYTII